jgi:hypothetical protein
VRGRRHRQGVITYTTLSACVCVCVCVCLRVSACVCIGKGLPRRLSPAHDPAAWSHTHICSLTWHAQATMDISLDSLARRGIFVSFGNASGAVPPFPVLRLIGKSAYVTR